MKKQLITSLLLTAAALAIAIAGGLSSPWEQSNAENPGYAAPHLSTPSAAPIESGGGDANTALRVKDGDAVAEMSMRDYLIGVLAAEVPAKFEPQALAAQAAAARTFALYNKNADKPKHTDADICTDYHCCADYADEARMREKWGADYDANLAKITAAVDETNGVYLTYDGAPILAVFHAASYAATENSENVWGSAYPYLRSAISPETEEDYAQLISSVTISLPDFKAAILAEYPEADLSGDIIGAAIETTTGRISTIKIGGVRIEGTKLRQMFELRSTALSIEISGGDVIITTAGYGHGVGLSQYGANAMAKAGASWRQILRNYYYGAEFSDGGGELGGDAESV